MRDFWKTLLGGIAAAIVVFSAPSAMADSVLRFAQTQTLPNFNPYILAPAYDSMVNNVFDVLTRYDENLVPQPRLAESWSFSEDGKTLTMKLRKGVKFHSGRPFTSKDVAFSVSYVQNPDNGALIRSFAKRVLEIQTPDDYTVVLKFAGPFPGVFDLLELLYIVDSETASDFSKTAVGTGPFKITSHQTGARTVFSRNDDYWNGAPSLEAFELVISPNQQAELLGIKSGDIDLTSELGWIDVLPFSRDSNFVTGTAPSGIAHDLSLNLRREVLKNPAVRKAIDLSIDRARIAKLVFGPKGRTWCLPFNPNSMAYFKEYDNCEFNLEKAKAVLDSAGVKTPIELNILTSTEVRTEYTTIAEILQADLAKIGINLSIENVDAVGYRSRYVDQRDYDLCSHAFGRAGKDPSSLLETTVVFRPDDNITGYDNPAYREAVMAGGSTPDLDQRRAAYEKVAKIFREDLFILPIIPRMRLYVAQKRVSGVQWSADGFAIFEKAKVTE